MSAALVDRISSGASDRLVRQTTQPRRGPVGVDYFDLIPIAMVLADRYLGADRCASVVLHDHDDAEKVHAGFGFVAGHDQSLSEATAGARICRRWLTLVVDTDDLAQRIPGLMAKHADHTWEMLSSGGPERDLVLELRPAADPSRVASVEVRAGAEVYQLRFAGHEETDFAYEDGDRLEALREQIDLAVAATTGPTRVTLRVSGDVVVRSQLVVHPDRPDRIEGTKVSWPFRRLKALLRGRRTTEKVLDFPAI